MIFIAIDNETKTPIFRTKTDGTENVINNFVLIKFAHLPMMQTPVCPK